MCFYKGLKTDVAKKAHQDIFAVKLLIKSKNGKLKSPHQTATWTLKKKKRCTTFDPVTANSLEVHYGLHCYKVMNLAACGTKHYAGTRKAFLVKIPEGAMYYENGTEICASQMVVLSEIKIPK